MSRLQELPAPATRSAPAATIHALSFVVPLGRLMFAAIFIMSGTHLWEFDCVTGEGINPKSCGLSAYPVRVEDGTIQVGVADSAA